MSLAHVIKGPFPTIQHQVTQWPTHLTHPCTIQILPQNQHTICHQNVCPATHIIAHKFLPIALFCKVSYIEAVLISVDIKFFITIWNKLTYRTEKHAWNLLLPPYLHINPTIPLVNPSFHHLPFFYLIPKLAFYLSYLKCSFLCQASVIHHLLGFLHT